jgi:hypothetical protein
MKQMTRIFFAALLGTLIATAAVAEVPQLIPVQGVLSDGEGEFVTGVTNIIFRIYDSESAAIPLWTEVQSVAVEGGFFTAYLGDLTPLPVEVLGAAGELWLGVTVGADPEMNRTEFAAVPFALFCENAVGDITPASISVGGNLVVNSDGEWVGPGMYAAGAGLTLSGTLFAADIGTAAGTVAAGDHGHDYSAVYAALEHDHDADYAAIGHDHDADYMASVTCAAGLMLKATAAGWECAEDLDEDTTYSAGTGLTLTGTQFAASIGTAAGTVAAGDHGHDEFADFAQFDETISAIDCSTVGQVLKWNSATWVCAADEDTNTTYTAGTGLTMTGTQLAADTSVLQARVGATCGAGSSIRAIAADGTVTCQTDTNTTYTAGAGLTMSGTQLSVSGVISSMITDGTITSADINPAGNVQLRTTAPTCPAGSYLQTIAATGAPTCVLDANTAGPGTMYTVTGIHFVTNRYYPNETVEYFGAISMLKPNLVGHGFFFGVMNQIPDTFAGRNVVLNTVTISYSCTTGEMIDTSYVWQQENLGTLFYLATSNTDYTGDGSYTMTVNQTFTGAVGIGIYMRADDLNGSCQIAAQATYSY